MTAWIASLPWRAGSFIPVFNWNFSNQPDPSAHMGRFGLRIGIEVSIHPAAEELLLSKGETVPTPIVGTGIIDTGCTVTAIDDTIAKQLGLVPIGIANLGTAGGSKQALQYPFAITLSPGLRFNCIAGVGCDVKAQGIDALIGLDLLHHTLFVLNGPAGTFSIGT